MAAAAKQRITELKQQHLLQKPKAKPKCNPAKPRFFERSMPDQMWQTDNYRLRRCLRGRTVCEMFAGAKHHPRGYTARQRKDAFDGISDLAMNLMLEQPARTQGHADAAWRQAVQTWLQQLGIITISEPKSVTQFP